MIQQELQTGVSAEKKAVQPRIQPSYPQWPHSTPGPWATPPPAGMRPINAIRREQVTEIGYNQEAGPVEVVEVVLPAAPEKPATAQKALGRRKQRL